MPKKTPVPELEFLKLTQNHGELGRKLVTLGIPAPDLSENAKYICQCWFGLAQEHLADAHHALSGKRARAVYSRSYYAAYNASKAARYMVQGIVSLKADDHGQASTNLPPDLPDIANWSEQITKLYEHRLHADYDNWADTAANQTFAPAEAVAIAEAFVAAVRDYLNVKFGAFL
jgi:hypothetical protein